MSHTTKKLIFALGLSYALAICWVVYADVVYHNQVPLDAIEFHGLYPLSVGLSAIAAARIFDRNLKGLAVKATKLKYILLPVLYALLLLIVPAAVNLLSGILKVGNLSSVRPEYILALPVILFLALAEEIMWRGVVYGALAKKYSYMQVALITAVLWAVWHYPVLIHTHFIYTDRPLWFVLLGFTTVVFLSSIIYTYLRHASGSVWPCVILHGIWNYVAFAFISPTEQTATPYSIYFRTDIGVPYILMLALMAVYAARKLQHKSRHESHKLR